MKFVRGAAMAGICAAVLSLRAAVAWPSDMLTINAGGQGRAALARAWGLNPADADNLFSSNGQLRAVQIGGSIPANILWPGDTDRMTVQFQNLTDRPIVKTGRLITVRYELYTPTSAHTDVFDVHIRKVADAGSVPISIDLPAHGVRNVVVTPLIPARFGGYAVVADFPGMDRLFVAGCVRSIKPDEAPTRFPRLAMDCPAVELSERLGVAPNRIGVPYKPTTDPDYASYMADLEKTLDTYRAAHIPLMIEFGINNGLQPGDCYGRSHLDDKGVMTGYAKDFAWLPSQDPDFQRFVERIAVKYGWPKGPVSAMKFMNEPWNGGGISGWNADDERYREIFRALCRGVAAAKREDGVDIYTGGTDSSSDTGDKLFSDGKTTYLPNLDFMSIHYQGLNPATAIKMFNARKGPHGPVRVWDTESWVANSDERIAAYDATCYAAGLDRVVGTQSDQVGLSERNVEMVGSDGGKETRRVPHSWSAVPALAASNRFMGSRRFNRILFPKGLPWVYVFDGLPRPDGKPNPEDGTVVVVGDLGPIFGDSKALFWKVRSRAEAAHKELLRRRLASLPATAAPQQRKALTDALAAFEPISGATMTVSAPDDSFSLYDYYGNRVPTRGGRIAIPLDSRGFYLRGDGRPGSFAKLIRALKAARIDGYQPLDYACRDMMTPIARHPSVRLTLSNILNRRIKGTLQVSLGGLAVAYPKTLSFAPYETKEVLVTVTGGAQRADNCYPLSMTFDAGPDGRVVHDETMHVNEIAERTIAVDGRLDDWKGTLPQPISVDEAARPTQMEAAWKPWQTFDSAVKVGNAVAYLACDDRYFYFAAKIADTTPDDGTVRFAARDDNSYFYPDTWLGTDVKGKTGPFTWPAGVRHYTYRTGPDLPGTGGDNVQIAFNVLPASAKPWAPAPPGTMPGFIDGWDTDYEYALDRVSPRYGGGTEIWRLSYPGMPHKHFYPRDPKSPFDGPVRGGKLVMRRDSTTRYVECAIPWSEIPAVKAARDAGRPVKFSYRVTDNASDVCMELSKGRSVARQNGITFHPDWKEHWANELEFGFQGIPSSPGPFSRRGEKGSKKQECEHSRHRSESFSPEREKVARDEPDEGFPAAIMGLS